MTDSRFKRIVVCCDGTWNNSDGTNQPPTNVTKLARCIKHIDNRKADSPIRQIVYYQSGIGSTSDTAIDRTFDGATGQGISDHVRQAYGFICNNYQHVDDDNHDEIFLFGFSRGAFTARTISSLIHDVGLLTPHGLGYFLAIFRAWERQNQELKDISTSHLGTMSMTWPELQKRLSETDLTRPKIKIKVCGVWDTVGSLGMPIAQSLMSKLSLNVIDGNPNPYSFVNTEVCDNIEYAFHAIALDEHRKHFGATIWEQPDRQKWPRMLKQCWFTGYHTHIGGGNDTNNMLPNIALAWMITQIKDLLHVEFSTIKAEPHDRELATALHLEGEANPDSGEIKDSKAGWFAFDGIGKQGARTPGQYKRINPKTMREIKEVMVNTNETIHSSVRRRFWGKDLLHQHPYLSEALRGWEPKSDPPRWVSQHHGSHVKDIPEEEMTEYELEIYGAWFPGFKSIEDFDLKQAQHATH